jgi:hypothetical protein
VIVSAARPSSTPNSATPVLDPNGQLIGEALFSFAIPSLAALSGTRVPVQSATIASLANVVYLGNTASLWID